MAKIGKASVPADVENGVVSARAVDDVGVEVVDHVVGAEGVDQVHLRCVANSGYVAPESLGDLGSTARGFPRPTDDPPPPKHHQRETP